MNINIYTYRHRFDNMANLQRCSKCKSEQELKYFSINKKGQYYKTCDMCRDKRLANKVNLKRTDTDFVDYDNVSTTTPDITEEEHAQEQKKYKRSIPIDATDVAAILGLNKYKTNLHEIVMKYWERGFPLKFHETQDKLQKEGIKFVSVKTSDEQIEEVCSAKGIPIDFDVLEDVDELLEQLNKEDDLDAADITSFCNKQMGIQFEKSAIARYEEKFNVKVDAVDNYVKREFKDNGLCAWMVGGRVDGVIGFDKIIEIKNRKKGFYPCIPIYEILQLYTYMFAMDIHQASLVEMYDSEIKETHFIYTTGYETYALSRLSKFCNFMEEFVNDVNLSERFMKCSIDDVEQVGNINNLLLDKLDIKHMKNVKVTPIKDIITKSDQALPEKETPLDGKYIIVMDVETNGLIKQRGITPTLHNLHMFPHVVQFSWGLFTEKGECKVMKDYIIKPDGWDMNGSDRIHGITYERANQEGVDIKTVLQKYKHDIDNHCSKLVCHNLDFDKNVVLSEFLRHGMCLNGVGEFCTMKNTMNHCRITPKVRGEYKWPTLAQLYRYCFSENLQNAHNSYYDVMNFAKCYFKLHLNNDDTQQGWATLGWSAQIQREYLLG